MQRFVASEGFIVLLLYNVNMTPDSEWLHLFLFTLPYILCPFLYFSWFILLCCVEKCSAFYLTQKRKPCCDPVSWLGLNFELFSNEMAPSSDEYAESNTVMQHRVMCCNHNLLEWDTILLWHLDLNIFIMKWNYSLSVSHPVSDGQILASVSVVPPISSYSLSSICHIIRIDVKMCKNNIYRTTMNFVNSDTPIPHPLAWFLLNGHIQDKLFLQLYSLFFTC